MIFIASKNNNNLINENKIGYDNLVFLENFCNLTKYNEESNNILILQNLKVNKKGFLEYYDYFLEEFFITVPVCLVIANKKTKKLIEICNYYKVPVIKI